MDIQEYVCKALQEIDAGIREANQHTKDRSFMLKRSDSVKFDLAVVNKVLANGKIKAMIFEIGSGKEPGVSKDQISRIKFEIEHNCKL